MTLLDQIRLHVERLRTAPGEGLGRGARFARFQLQLWRFCARRLWENNLTAMSAALSFRTIFALIPAIVLVVLVLKSMGVLEDGKRSLHKFLEGSGFSQIAMVESPPGESEAVASPADRVVNVADEIERLVEEVESKLTFQRVGPVGIVLLIWTALTLLTTMERSLNRVFGAVRPRPLGRRLLLYWAVLTLGPLVLMTASYLGREATGSVQDAPGTAWLAAVAGWVGPTIVGIFVMAAVYKLLPHTAVRYRAAVGGAVVSVPLWLVAKWGFAVYVTKLVGTGNLYGALGLLPLFLVWVNLSWLIFLFGAELANTAANLNRMQLAEQAERTTLGPSDLLAAAIAVAEPYLAGRGPTGLELVAARLHLPAESVQGLLDRLAAARVVCPVDNEGGASYVLARPAETIPVLEIVGVDSPDRVSAPTRRPEAEMADTVSRVWTHARSVLGTFTLAKAVQIGREQAENALSPNASSD